MQARLDRGPHGVPRGSSTASQSCNGGSLEAQLSNRPADRPHTQTCPGCAHLLAMLQERHRLAGAFAAYPAPYCATGSARGPRPKGASITSTSTRPWPCAITPQPGQPAQRSQDSLSSTGPHSRRATATRWKHPPSRQADHADHNDQATQSSSR